MVSTARRANPSFGMEIDGDSFFFFIIRCALALQFAKEKIIRSAMAGCLASGTEPPAAAAVKVFIAIFEGGFGRVFPYWISARASLSYLSLARLLLLLALHGLKNSLTILLPARARARQCAGFQCAARLIPNKQVRAYYHQQQLSSRVFLRGRNPI